MKLLPYNCRQYLKGAALVVIIATPGSLLVLPLVAWWMARKNKNGPSGIRVVNRPPLSFPRRRESITRCHMAHRMDSRLRGNDSAGIALPRYTANGTSIVVTRRNSR